MPSNTPRTSSSLTVASTQNEMWPVDERWFHLFVDTVLVRSRMVEQWLVNCHWGADDNRSATRLAIRQFLFFYESEQHWHISTMYRALWIIWQLLGQHNKSKTTDSPMRWLFPSQEWAERRNYDNARLFIAAFYVANRQYYDEKKTFKIYAKNMGEDMPWFPRHMLKSDIARIDEVLSTCSTQDHPILPKNEDLFDFSSRICIDYHKDDNMVITGKILQFTLECKPHIAEKPGMHGK